MNEDNNEDKIKTIQNLPNRSTFDELKFLENDLSNLTAEKVFTKDYFQTTLTPQHHDSKRKENFGKCAGKNCSCLSGTANTVKDNCCSRSNSSENNDEEIRIKNLGENIKSNENLLLIEYREKVYKLLEEFGFDKNSG